ncbi:cell surface protein SprA [Muribaculaceae bacterium Isolate-083 (Janvier)]|uniref:T9SS outer membrane translocon Sov/SprA n=5 Tax=Duncaniella muris TaxID=2094150 RepID=UPI000F4A8192|nr:cell surface protein SprA [Duncaniella muris]ROS95238.1 cell surface protein SprA [Muribaculaceae bacterium Isolate-077 (Janvier)]ROS98291.1 cell surface protein SprA [Muribaculaceae bacterium Isolate-084 (Janvier)]ROS99358.1 cell surface protein SprA [Muribaculaceae bacterium Isolate-083 (Janvier)]
MAILTVTSAFFAFGQSISPEFNPPAPVITAPQQGQTDTITTLFPVRPLIPQTYDELMQQELATDLDLPSNISTTAEFDPQLGCYVIRTRLGESDIVTPFYLTPQQYNTWQTRRQMQDYFRLRNAEALTTPDKEPFNILDMNFALGPLEKIFGPGGVQLKTQGSVNLSMGVKTNKTDNPALALDARRRTYFDFDQKIQATVNASVGDRMKFNMTYNTDATFDFDSKNIKLAYEGKEDDIVKSIEAGNVSMTTGSSLIRGSTALFGIKTQLQFGKLTATALVSQQNSQSTSVSSKGGVQTTEFSINADEYDQNRHFFLGHFFRDNYDVFASRLPYVSSGIQITRIEVWITNRNARFDQSRNFVAFMDLGENRVLASDYWLTDPAYPQPSNLSNNLLSTIKNDYPAARNINTVTQALAPLSALGINGGMDYEKVESARLLSSSEYTLNPTLGYISLKSALASDEVLGVAYEYTYNGKVYQVGEFSADISTTDQSLYLKMLKSTTINPKLPMWDLMMKNVYSLGAYQISKSDFRLNIKYLSDTTGTQINYLPVAPINNVPLLQVMNLDRIDSNEASNPDGFFDFIEGYTILSSQGKIIFPVVEPFGSNLEKKIGNAAAAEPYVYNQLYDSTLIVARQFADKNKFILSGRYKGAEGSSSQIRLNAMNVPRGSVVVTAGGVPLVENSDYTVDYTMGIVTITNQSIIDSGQSINVTLENQSLYSMQRKTLLGLDLNYKFNKDFNLGATIMHFSEKAQTEKVNIGDEIVNNTIWGLNMQYNTQFMWLTNLLNKIPTVNAVQPSTLSLQAEFANLIPHKQKSGSNRGSSYIDDFESTQIGIDLRSPYSWFLASTPYDPSGDALFPEASLSNDIRYGKNRALINWYYIDRMFTARNSSMCPGYIKNDPAMLNNPYVREITSREIFPGRERPYGESNTIQTLNLSFYPTERGPYNLDATDIDDQGNLLYPDRRWGGIMRKMDNTNFDASNIEYVQFWMLSPFLDPDNDNLEGGDLYLNFGEISEDILKDGLKSYENGVPVNGDDQFMQSTVWGRVSTQNSLTYAFDNNSSSRLPQDVGLDGLINEDEFGFSTYSDYLAELRRKLSPSAIERMEADPFSPFNDPAGDNYHFFRGYDYDEQRLGVLERYKRYNGVEGNSLSPSDATDPLYQSSRALPDVEDINQDNTLNEYERYFQYKISIRPEDLVVGKNYITDKQVSVVVNNDQTTQEVVWYQFKIPLSDYQKVVGNISDFSTIRFARMFMTGFKAVTHLRFATLELVRGEWRPYQFNLNSRGDAPAEGQLDMSVVNIEENSKREPVNYVLPPGVSRITDPGQSQIVQLNEQSLSLKVTGLQPGDARGIYKNTHHDLRNYKKLQMWVHAEKLIDDMTKLQSGEISVFLRLGTDVRSNYYEYEVPLQLTPAGKYADDAKDRAIVWPRENYMDFNLQALVDLKKERNRAKNEQQPGVGFATLFTGRDPDNERNRMAVIGNPSLSDVRVMLIGVRNNASTAKDAIVWLNELKVTDFESEGGWAAKGNLNIGVSDIATLNFGAHVETAGFGGVDQSLNARRMDDYEQYNFALQVDAGRFLPEKVKLRAPIYYSVSKEIITPKYNPLDQDVRLKDALDACATEAQKDSIRSYSVEHSTIKSFSISGLKFDVKSKNPMPWDPANFTINFSFNKQSKTDPTTEYENTNDYRGSLQYSYTPYLKGVKPFSFIKSKSKHMKFFKEWEFNYLPSNITFLTTISRYYYEMQTRSETDVDFQLPVSVSKNFIWDRQLSLTWNLTKSLTFNFNSNTSARIEETMGAVNRKLFPDKYKEWKDTVLQSILHLGTPWSYNQSFVASYRAPFNKIPVLDWLTGNISYNSTYRWDRGAEVDGIETGNSIANQASWNMDGRVNFESLYNKWSYTKKVNQRFQAKKAQTRVKKPKKFERTYALLPDTTLTVRHNLRNSKVKVKATTVDGKPFRITHKVKDANSIEVLTRGDQNIKFTIEEVLKEEKTLWREIGEYASRFVMSPRNASFRFRSTNSLSLPLFRPTIGNVFGQSRSYGPMSPGLDFAFGFTDESYIDKALHRGWLITDDGQTSPAIFAHTKELNFDLTLEPVKGLKIVLTTNRTDNRTRSVQFMYDNMPTALAGSYTKTHVALKTALRHFKADNGYASDAFNDFLANIPVIANRVRSRYAGLNYPMGGFMEGNINAGNPFNPSVGDISPTSSDVLIPAFIAAYSGTKPGKQYLTPFPSFADALPNWRVTYDGLIYLGNLRNVFKAFTLSHAYQCTYSVGSYSSYLNWMSADKGDLGFTIDELTGNPVPTSPYNISSVAITEKFAPLLGAAVTLKNDLTISADYRDSRTLTLNTSAGQVVEANQRGLTIGLGYKIIGFNTVLKMKGSGRGISNDLTLNADFAFSETQALIRRIETAYTQPTSGTRSLTMNFTASYIMSRRLTLGAFFDHQINTPIVSSTSYPTANTSFGFNLNLSLAR